MTDHDAAPRPGPNAGSAALRAAYKPRVPIGTIATKAKVSPETIRRWAKGQATPPAEAMAVLEDLLGIPMRAWTQPVGTPLTAPSSPVLDVPSEDE